MIKAAEVRRKFLHFFKSKGHKAFPSASLLPDGDPSVLFTTAGMQPLVPYLIGRPHPAGTRLASLQKCLRTQDIGEVGDKTHITFFEMLGNWSLGDYFKKEAICWSWEFLTGRDWLGLDPTKIAISVFAGDKHALKDSESAQIWQSLGVKTERIVYLGKSDNWWGPAGQTGPCGPDTEMFYWIDGDNVAPRTFNPSDERWLEIWNDVFMQYNKTTAGRYESLRRKNVDTGMGVERILVALNGLQDIFQIDTLRPLISKIEELCGRKYLADKTSTKSMRIIADHIRSAVMIMSDDRTITPSNTDQGYVIRRLIRRAIRHSRLLGIASSSAAKIADPVIEIFKKVYPEVKRNQNFAFEELAKEEALFSSVVTKGLKEVKRIIEQGKNKIISGKDAFNLFATYGFPLEMTEELADERGLKVDAKGFLQEFSKHQELSRVGAALKFKGGLADHSQETTKLHTATHLLHAALRQVLGGHLVQKGSNITKERLRFDFSHPQKMTDEEVKLTEALVNQAIKKNYAVTWREMTFAEAKTQGAIGLFADKYGSRVRVYSIGDPNSPARATIDSPTFSREVCAGPHVENTSAIGHFKITKEAAVATGVRRIKAVLNDFSRH